MRVAYLGPAGTFTEQALWQLVDAGDITDHEGVAVGRDAVVTIPVTSPAAALDAVAAGDAACAVVAVENSVDGPVTHTFDALAQHPGLHIYAETDVEIAFAIMVRPGFAREEVRSFATHPVARPQVATWVATTWPEVDDIPASSNAAAAQAVADGTVDAAAAPARAADVYGLEIIADGIAEVTGTRTRFILVGPARALPPASGRDRTGIILTLPNVPGSLHGALTEIALRGVDVARLESRPTRTGLGTYRFHLDVRGHLEDAPIAEMLLALKRYCEDVQFLGSWRTQDEPEDRAHTAGETDVVPAVWPQAAAWLEELRAGGSGQPPR
ncbi:prephenate dehydratase [Corynebacterium sp. 13CS0277]|uniref:prephenate dehydratase n=1 Tax=Corynebacterium sp. 13CS0277 TaxID=2071994 RepID=UPI003510DF83